MASWKDGINGEKSFMKIWIIEGAYRWLGHVVAMIGHGISFYQTNILSFIFPLLSTFLAWTPIIGIDS
jgi:hypothetical protein